MPTPSSGVWELHTTLGFQRIENFLTFASDDIWAIGLGGVIHWDGVSWSAVTGPGGGFGIWGSAPDDIWTTYGSSGYLFHYDGDTWTFDPGPGGDFLTDDALNLWGAATDDIWMMGQFGNIAHYDGVGWTNVASVGGTYNFGMYGFASNDVWAGGDDGKLHHWNGSAWSTTVIGEAGTELFNSIYGVAPNDVWAVGALTPYSVDTVGYHWNGSVWSRAHDNNVGQIRACWGPTSDNIWFGCDYPTNSPNRIGQFYGTIGSGLNFVWPPPVDHEIHCITGTSATDMWAAGGVDLEGAIYRLTFSDAGTVVVSGVTGVPLGIRVEFDHPVNLTGDSLFASKWVVTGGGEVPLTVFAVTPLGDASTVLLTTNEATTGASYSLAVPQGIKRDSNATPLLPPYDHAFTGVGVAPTAFIAQVIDSRHVRVIFSEPVLEAGASVVGNYSIDNGLEALEVEVESATAVILTTTEQTPDTTYTVTITNVYDRAGNVS